MTSRSWMSFHVWAVPKQRLGKVQGCERYQALREGMSSYDTVTGYRQWTKTRGKIGTFMIPGKRKGTKATVGLEDLAWSILSYLQTSKKTNTFDEYDPDQKSRTKVLWCGRISYSDRGVKQAGGFTACWRPLNMPLRIVAVWSYSQYGPVNELPCLDHEHVLTGDKQE